MDVKSLIPSRIGIITVVRLYEVTLSDCAETTNAPHTLIIETIIFLMF